MSGPPNQPQPQPQPQSIHSQPQSLSEEASNLVCRISKLLCRLHDLKGEEAKLDARARQLWEQPGPKPTDGPSTPPRPTISTPFSRLRVRDTESTTETDTPSTPPHIDPKNFETPVKAFLLMQSFALAMSVRSKRKGRVFLTGDGSEFGERT